MLPVEKSQFFWVQKLHGLRLNRLAAWLIEAFAPLSIIGAGVIQIGTPTMRLFMAADQLNSLSSFLENPQNLLDFAALLRNYEEHLS